MSGKAWIIKALLSVNLPIFLRRCQDKAARSGFQDKKGPSSALYSLAFRVWFTLLRPRFRSGWHIGLALPVREVLALP